MVFAFFTATQPKQKPSLYVYATSAKRRIGCFHNFSSNIRLLSFILKQNMFYRLLFLVFPASTLLFCIQRAKRKSLIFKTPLKSKSFLLAHFHTWWWAKRFQLLLIMIFKPIVMTMR